MYPLGGADGQPADGHAFQEQVRLPLHDDAVLERARLALVGVADHVSLADGARVGGRASLDPAGNPAPPRPRRIARVISSTTLPVSRERAFFSAPYPPAAEYASMSRGGTLPRC